MQSAFPYDKYPTHFQFQLHEPNRQGKNYFQVFTVYFISPCGVRFCSRRPGRRMGGAEVSSVNSLQTSERLTLSLCFVAQLYLTLHNPMNGSPPGSSVHEDSLGKNTGVGCHALLQGIFPTQGSNPGLLQCRRILYQLSPKGSPGNGYRARVMGMFRILIMTTVALV